MCVCVCVCCITNLYCISLEEHPIKLWKKKTRLVEVRPQGGQAQNMSISIVAWPLKYKDLYGRKNTIVSVTYDCERMYKKVG